MNRKVFDARKPLHRRFNAFATAHADELSAPTVHSVRLFYPEREIYLSERNHQGIVAAEEILLRNRVPYGYLVSRVRHIKNTYRLYAGLDACMSNLMRPALYGAYHEIVVPGKEQSGDTTTYDVTGSLCENNDKFAIQRVLPLLERGDLVVICDAGAHGHAMGFQYNGKLRSAELLLEEDGLVREIRRAETLDDYFATLDFEKL